MSEKNIKNTEMELKDDCLNDVIGGDGNESGDFYICSCGATVYYSEQNKHMKKCPDNPYK